MAEQPYTPRTPKSARRIVQKNEEKVEPRVSPARPDYALDLSDDEPVSRVLVPAGRAGPRPNSPERGHRAARGSRQSPAAWRDGPPRGAVRFR
jgi:hypothetical protein